MSTPLDWFVVSSLCWLPILIGMAGSYGLARMFEAMGWIEEE
ncbi:unnamed protein product [marine sediment metagenome]|uniref:Uncharacterized protein n=1 Tax=marine sediment metagenome TaxID=412755 RepID=X0U992_9ZZZZ